MFYSQFILAKKGPLGTIWIAAHLERKLRKNQVADTDIGVSVDSILFPEVPIALRLSSHLLLGVVRIYSRKVNYLFHDCSEALLKIKQAFRSTAVDLPPEESTAPYHSITLPETFDLDDFELADSSFLQGNFVDHHVSTREQITLQDSMDGTGYSISQFGLDERFGDGDASQICLDLDEDLLLNKNTSSQQASVPLGSEEGAVHQGECSIPLTDIDVYESQNGYDKYKCPETPKDLSELLSNDCGKHVISSMANLKRNDDSSHRHGYNIQTPDLNEMLYADGHIDGLSAVPNHVTYAAGEAPSPALYECAQAPSTPGLMEEAILANVQRISALSPHEKSSSSNAVEVNNPDTCISPRLEYQSLDAANLNDLMHGVTLDPEPEDSALVVSSPTPVLTESKPIGPEPQCSVGFLAVPDESPLEYGQMSEDNLQNRFISSGVKIIPTVNDNVEAILPEVACLEGRVTPRCSHKASNLESPFTKSTNDTAVVVTSNDIVLVPGLTLEINITSHENKAKPSIFGNQDHLEDANSCLTSYTSALIPDFNLRSCNSRLNQANISSFEDGALVENAPVFSHREPSWISETTLREEALRVSGSSAEVQGEDNHKADVTDTTQEVYQKSEFFISEFKSGVNNLDELSTGLISKDTQLDHMNCYSSSEYPEPEKMLLAPSGDADLTNDLGQLTAVKGVIESAGSVDKISTLCGRKHRLVDSSPVLRSGSSAKVTGLPRVRRNTAYIPDDDDLLASILVERAPVLRIGPTPPTKVVSRKQPRLTQRVGFPKRKVLLDDTTILHADAIRKQLINTEDIRRLRKKAPCTRPEIFMIQKSSMEEELFGESLFAGISAELHNLHTRRYDLNGNSGPQIDVDEHHSYVELSKEMEHCRSTESFRERSGKAMVEPTSVLPNKVNGEMQGPSGTSLSTEAQNYINVVEFDAQEKLDSCAREVELSSNNQTIRMSTVETNVCESAVVEVPLLSAHSGSEHEISSNSRLEESSIQKNSRADLSPEMGDTKCMHQQHESLHELIQSSEKLSEIKDGTLTIAASACVSDIVSAEDGTRCRIVDSVALASANDDTFVQPEETCIAKDESILKEGNVVDVVDLNCPQYAHANVGKTANGVALISMLDSCALEDRAGVPADCFTSIGDANSFIPFMAIKSGEPAGLATITGHQTMEEMKEGGLEVIIGGEIVVEGVLSDEERRNTEIICSETPQVVSSYPLQPITETENVLSAVGENSGLQECHLEVGLDAESTPMNISATKESSDFCSAIDGNDTEFLNVDEAYFDEEGDNDVPNPEEAQSFENSGWSSRTRGVARYLKTLFDEESGRGRKTIAMDHLIAGKTRKEASRMFFETLVLKTRDYIQVEQENPFVCINIKPRTKLLKSEF